MADQGKWFKLWCSALDDAELENLEIHEWFCWTRFGVYLKKHGEDGSIYLKDPCRVLQTTFRVDTYKQVIQMLLRFPNILLSTGPIKWPHGYIKDPVCEGEIVWGRRVGERGVSTPHEESVEKVLKRGYVFVSLYNWDKYQSDKSTQRVKTFREKRSGEGNANETLQEEKRREEKRREEITPSPKPPSGGSSKVLEWFEKTWEHYPRERRTGKQAALRSYQKRVKTLADAEWVAGSLENYLKSKTVADGYIKNASTFFANVEDYADARRDISRATSPVTERPSNRTDQDVRGFATAAGILSQFPNNPVPGNSPKTDVP